LGSFSSSAIRFGEGHETGRCIEKGSVSEERHNPFSAFLFQRGANMLTIGVILVVIASIIRGWVLLNYRRPDHEQSMIFYKYGALFSVGVLAVQIMFALLGAFLMGLASGIWIGLVAFGLFWFVSFVWCPILRKAGL